MDYLVQKSQDLMIELGQKTNVIFRKDGKKICEQIEGIWEDDLVTLNSI